jgi:hypothetical protein
MRALLTDARQSAANGIQASATSRDSNGTHLSVADELRAHGVNIRIRGPGGPTRLGQMNETHHADFQNMLSTSYGLVLRGHARWTHRFTETLGACAIPAVLADGWPLPLDHLIDWSEAAIVFLEALALDPRELVRRLPTNPLRILQMRARACELYDSHFAIFAARFDATLRSAVRIVDARARNMSDDEALRTRYAADATPVADKI